MRRIRRLVSGIAAAGIAAAGLTVASGPQASAAPNFQVPFQCGETVTAATWQGHSPENAVDFQKDGISGMPVLSSAGGTVSRVADEGDTSYGKWVEVDHGSGWTTRYAHLSEQAVSVGQDVSTGTRLGAAGNTGGSTGPHLHYEQRHNGSAVKATLHGVDVPYYGKTEFTSKNCDGGSNNPYTPQEVCGSGFSVINSHELGNRGTVYLMYNSSTGRNCVTTLKETGVGSTSTMSATLEVQGGPSGADKGQFSYYAGPVRLEAAQTCVQWGGSIGDRSYTSPFEHCG